MVAIRSLQQGQVLSANDVDFKRPGTGIRPDELEYVVGRPLLHDIAAQEEFEWSDFA
jgi:N-acetylneuraminate synthase